MFLKPDEKINILKYGYNAEAKEQEHTHDFIEIAFITSGSGLHFINGTSFYVERGDLLFINFTQTHSFYTYSEMTLVNCLVNPEFISHELIDSENAFEMLTLASFAEFFAGVDDLTPKVSFRGMKLLEVETLIENMFKEFQGKQTGYKMIVKGYLQVLLAKIFRQMKSSHGSPILQNENKITPYILKYIEENCFEKITLKEVAQKCCYNPSYFSRIFKDCFGKSMTEYIHEKRIIEAVRLLKETDSSVEDVCYAVGYKEKKQFYKIFKEYMGVTPSKIRSPIQK